MPPDDIDLTDLAKSVEGLAKAIEQMATKDDVAFEASRRRWAVLAGAAAIVLLAFVSIANVAVLNRLADVADTNRRNGRVLVECTTPSPGGGRGTDREDDVHECFERGQAQTAAVIGRLTLGMLDAAVCARTEPNPQAIRACFEETVAAKQGGP